MTITKTDLAIVVKCKCGGTIAASMIYGGMDINEDFTDTIANTYLKGGKIDLIKTSEVKVKLDGCKCFQIKELKP